MIFFRLDERLTHGQVVTNWIHFLGVTHIVVADDGAAEDELQKSLLKMSVPAELKFVVVDIEKAISILSDKRCEDRRILAICSNPRDSYRIISAVEAIEDVNLANYGFMLKADVPDKRMITSNLAVDEEDLDYIRKIQAKVKNTYCQVLSSQPKKPIIY
ncbi:MAG: PTS mannose/fructose/sorbose transporter subunit IIB [Clostridium sp.]|nr:PTS mannose/fructose/sorbose transporter subunit IIB [Clostridium sp.]